MVKPSQLVKGVRHFNGQKYLIYDMFCKTKKEANEKAFDLRQKGFNARVVPAPKTYLIPTGKYWVYGSQFQAKSRKGK